MSSILDFNASSVLFETPNGNGGLDIVAQPDSDNFIIISEVEGEASAANPGDDIVIGGNALDFISTSDGDDIIIGNRGDDLIDGGAGSDIIQGRDGDDIIIGGKGSDLLSGGEGEDIFGFNADDFSSGEVDSILDFEAGVDRVQINGVDPDRVTVEGSLIKLDGETIIELNGEAGTGSGATDEDTFELF